LHHLRHIHPPLTTASDLPGTHFTFFLRPSFHPSFTDSPHLSFNIPQQCPGPHLDSSSCHLLGHFVVCLPCFTFICFLTFADMHLTVICLFSFTTSTFSTTKSGVIFEIAAHSSASHYLHGCYRLPNSHLSTAHFAAQHGSSLRQPVAFHHAQDAPLYVAASSLAQSSLTFADNFLAVFKKPLVGQPVHHNNRLSLQEGQFRSESITFGLTHTSSKHPHQSPLAPRCRSRSTRRLSLFLQLLSTWIPCRPAYDSLQEASCLPASHAERPTSPAP
jgi:hypothetical protein